MIYIGYSRKEKPTSLTIKNKTHEKILTFAHRDLHPRPGSSGLYQVSGPKPGKNGHPGNDEQNSKVTLTLSTPRTRTTLVSETYVHWSEEDIVQINGTNLPVIPDPNDPTRATISNVDTAEEYVALYSPDNGGYIPEREVVEAYFRPEVPHTPDSFYTTGGNPMVAYSTSTSLEFKISADYSA